MKARLIICPCLVVVLAVAAAAQDTPFTAPSGSRPIVDADGTYVFNHVPNSRLILEAQVAPRIIVIDSFGQATRSLLAAVAKPVWGWQLSATPMVRLRLFNEASSPVRTPSYMPKATLQISRFRNLSRASASDDEDVFSKGPIAVWLVNVIPFGHHSNGQNGCLFTSQLRDARGECIEELRSQGRTINKTDGSFSTNYIEVMAHYGRMHLESEGAPETEYATRWQWRGGAGIQINPKGYLPGAIDDELADIYGPTRILFEAMAARRDGWRCGRVAARIRFQYIHEVPARLPAVTTLAEATCLPWRWGGTGVFVRFYRGQDYYNLGFADAIRRLQFGFALQQDTFLSFKIRPLNGS